jgi:DNA-binding transcriptional ArsR family regulator
MSLGDEGHAQVGSLRALAHPVRLQMLSLLTGAPMSAAEVARELGLTHANASYHLRQLLAAGQLTEAGEETIRGGRAKRYRYDLDVKRTTAPDVPSAALYYEALASELVRRARLRTGLGARGESTDAELWVPPEAWHAALDAVTGAMVALHRAAVPPRSANSVRVSATTALFEMGEEGRSR